MDLDFAGLKRNGEWARGSVRTSMQERRFLLTDKGWAEQRKSNDKAFPGEGGDGNGGGTDHRDGKRKVSERAGLSYTQNCRIAGLDRTPKKKIYEANSDHEEGGKVTSQCLSTGDLGR